MFPLNRLWFDCRHVFLPFGPKGLKCEQPLCGLGEAAGLAPEVALGGYLQAWNLGVSLGQDAT